MTNIGLGYRAAALAILVYAFLFATPGLAEPLDAALQAQLLRLYDRLRRSTSTRSSST